MPDNIMLDGEITLLNDYEVLYDHKNRPAVAHKLTSKEQYKETMKITRKDGEKHGVKMLVFDGMSVEDFENNQIIQLIGIEEVNLKNFGTTQRIAVTKWFTLNYFLSYIAEETLLKSLNGSTIALNMVKKEL